MANEHFMTYTVYTDASITRPVAGETIKARKKLRRAALGYIIYDQNLQMVAEGSEFSQHTGNSHLAELLAVMVAVRRAAQLIPAGDSILIYCDSKGVVNQVSWVKPPRALEHIPIVESIRRLLKDRDWQIEWIPRAKNKLADRLAGRVHRRQSTAKPRRL